MTHTENKFQKILFAGHSALFLKGGELSLAIDPWLEGNPSCPENLKNPEELDCIILTHGHSDHAGDILRLLKQTSATLIATYELAMIIVKEGISESRVVPMNKGGSVDFKGISISLTHAMHSSSYDTASGPVYAGEPCGVIVKDRGFTLYHAGDTALFSDMSLIRDSYTPDIAFLPIGDRFTMGPKEAARAAKLINASLNIPIHYNTFPPLTGTGEEFLTECRKNNLSATELEIGKEYFIDALLTTTV